MNNGKQKWSPAGSENGVKQGQKDKKGDESGWPGASPSHHSTEQLRPRQHNAAPDEELLSAS